MRLTVERLSVFFFIILRELNRFFHQAVKSLNVLVAQFKHKFEKILSCIVLTCHDTVNSLDEIVVSINEHLTVTSGQPYIINSELSTYCFYICVCYRVFSVFNKTDSTLLQTDAFTEFFKSETE